MLVATAACQPVLDCLALRLEEAYLLAERVELLSGKLSRPLGRRLFIAQLYKRLYFAEREPVALRPLYET